MEGPEPDRERPSVKDKQAHTLTIALASEPKLRHAIAMASSKSSIPDGHAGGPADARPRPAEGRGILPDDWSSATPAHLAPRSRLEQQSAGRLACGCIARSARRSSVSAVGVMSESGTSLTSS